VSGAPGDVRGLLARTTLVVRAGPYALAGWPLEELPRVAGLLARHDPARGAPCLVLVDDREVTALAPEAALAALPPPAALEGGWSVLTLDAVMAWDVVGVLAEVTAALADGGVPVGAFAAYSRDHVLVHRARLDEALELLGPLFAAVDQRGS